MKNIIMSIMLGVALLGSAQACNMQHRAHMHGHPGIHKQIKKHAMHRGHHRHGMVRRDHKCHAAMRPQMKQRFAIKPMMKRHMKPMGMWCERPRFANKRNHWCMFNKMNNDKKQTMRKPQANCHKRKFKITFGPTAKRNQMMFNDYPWHIRPSAEQLRMPLIDFDKYKKH